MKKNHLNIPDGNGDVYCHKVKDVVELDQEHLANQCANCPFFSGTIQGHGIECYWNDDRDIEEPYYPDSPQAELASVKLSEMKGE